MSRNLIIPIAADKEEYNDTLPYVFGLGNDGIIICIKSILGLELEKFDHIYFTILKKHDDAYFISESLQMQCKRLGIDNVKITILHQSTTDQVETIYKTIKQEQISGSIFIKDADCYFECKATEVNSVAIYPIEELEVLDPRNKSYVSIDDMFYITNIIEKAVVDRYISAGGYMFENCEEFCEYANRLREYGQLYLSHIVYAMLLDKKSFKPFLVRNFKDWGTKVILNLNQNGIYK